MTEQEVSLQQTSSVLTGSTEMSSKSSSGELQHHHQPKTSSRRKKNRPKSSTKRRVKKLRPVKALLQLDCLSVEECVVTMAEKRTEATLLISASDSTLSGILTDKDIAFSVIALGLDPAQTPVSVVMTPNPSCVSPNASAMAALKKMVSGQFRHLPVAENGKVVGLLDITKCLYDAIAKIEVAYFASSSKFSSAVKKLEVDIGGVEGASNLFEAMREKLFLPTLRTIITKETFVPEISIKASARDAAKMMLERNCSAVMVLDDEGTAVGIVTSKDLMRRVVAKRQNPTSCLVGEIMTLNPDCATLDTTILDALHSMHDGKFLHLPVLGEDGLRVVGLTDVLQVTYAVVHQMGTLHTHTTHEEVGPVWNQFWNSMLQDEDRSTASGSHRENSVGSGSYMYMTNRSDEDAHDVENLILKNSDHDINSDKLQLRSNSSFNGQIGNDKNLKQKNHTISHRNIQCGDAQNLFVYKILDRAKQLTHRFTSSAENLNQLVQDINTRLYCDTEISPALPSIKTTVCYVDDEDEAIVLFTDNDLKDAVAAARASAKRYLQLVLPVPSSPSSVSSNFSARSFSSPSVESKGSLANSSVKNMQSGTTGDKVKKIDPDGYFSTFNVCAAAAAVVIAGATVALKGNK